MKLSNLKIKLSLNNGTQVEVVMELKETISKNGIKDIFRVMLEKLDESSEHGIKFSYVSDNYAWAYKGIIGFEFVNFHVILNEIEIRDRS